MSLRSVIALSIALASASSFAADFDADKFLAEKCSGCHDSSVYTRPDHRVKSLEGLEQQVRRCDSMIGTKLFEDDIKTLVDDLNTKYYHF